MATSKSRTFAREEEFVKIKFRARVMDKIYNTATSIFIWNIDKDTLNNRLLNNEIERLLFHNGVCTVYRGRDGVIRARALGGNIQYNEYMEPVVWTAVPRNGRGWHKVNITNGVIIWNNKSKVATKAFIEDILDDMLNTDITIRQQLNATKTPYVFYGEENDMLQFKIEYEKIINGTGAFYKSKTKKLQPNGKPFEVFKSDVDYKCDKLMDLYDKYENRIYDWLGLQSNYIEKKAQMQNEEMTRGDDAMLLNFDAFKREREYGIKLMNETLGITATLEINEYLKKQRGEEPSVKNDEPKKQEKE